MEPEDLLGVFDYAGSCQEGGRGTLGPGPRSVTYQIWQNCGGTGTAATVLVIAPAGREYYAVVEVYLASVDDLRALGPILRSVQFGAQGSCRSECRQWRDCGGTCGDTAPTHADA